MTPTHVDLISNWDVFTLLLILSYVYYLSRQAKPRAADAIIYPESSPPESISPGLMRFLKYKQYDFKAMIAAIISMANKKHVNLVFNNYDNFVIQKKQDVPESVLSIDEKVLSDIFFEKNNKYDFEACGYKTINAYSNTCYKKLKVLCKNKYFFYNPSQKVILYLIMIAFAYMQTTTALDIDSTVNMILFVTLAILFIFHMLDKIKMSYLNYRENYDNRFMVFSIIFIVTVIAIGSNLYGSPIVYQKILSLWDIKSYVIGCIALNYGVRLTEYPTSLGADVLKKVDGLKLFFDQAKSRDNYSTELSKETYDELFPYAFVLNTEMQWSEAYTQVHNAKTQERFVPGWATLNYEDEEKSPLLTLDLVYMMFQELIACSQRK